MNGERQKVAINFLGQPMILITQIQRSGGTLLSQLFDGHPQIYAHPHELHIGRPKKWDWPSLDLNGDPSTWFGNLYEQPLEGFYNKGYMKPGSNPHAKKEMHPFSFNPALQQAVFLEVLKLKPARHQRDILNAYFTSFFAAWADTDKGPDKKYVTAFCPRVLMIPDSIERYIQDYPDGHIISSVRDPRTWYASSSLHSILYKDVRDAIALWKRSTERIINLKKARPDYIFFSTYENFVNETEEVMSHMASFLGIDFDESLLMPTHASRPILPNSSYARNSYGVNTQSTKTDVELDSDDKAYIEREAMPLYEEAAGL